MAKSKKGQTTQVALVPKYPSPWRNVFVVIFIYLTAWPIAYVFNKVMEGLLDSGYSTIWLAPISTAVMALVLILIYMGCSKNIKDYFFYGYAFFAFTCSIDVIIGLELAGVVTGFMSIYLRSGEPYLNSPYGAAICLYDGTAMLVMYLIMIFCISIKQSYRPVALYWSPGITNSLLVLILGAFTGRHGPHWCTALNIPYVIFPLAVGIYFWRHGAQRKTSHKQTLPWYMFPIHAVLLIYVILATAIQVLRTLVVLNNNNWVTKLWSTELEPLLLLDDPAPFIKVQVLVFFFYLLPVYGLSLLALLWPGYSSFLDISILHAGLAAQSQLSLMFTSLHPDTPTVARPPTDYPYSCAHWMINLGLLVGPQLLMLAGFLNPGWFQETATISGSAVAANHKSAPPTTKQKPSQNQKANAKKQNQNSVITKKTEKSGAAKKESGEKKKKKQQ